MTLLGKEVKEEADAHVWFMDRVRRYKRWMKRRFDEVSNDKSKHCPPPHPPHAHTHIHIHLPPLLPIIDRFVVLIHQAHIPLLSDAVEAETAGDDQTSSKEDLLPVDPVDDSPAPTYI